MPADKSNNEEPAFPTTEIVRRVGSSGMTTREYAVIHFVAALVQATPSISYERTVQNARDLADLALASDG